MTDPAQLAIFVKGVTSQLESVQEFAKLIPMRNTTTGKDIFDCVMNWMDEMNLDLSKLVGVTTDEEPAMVGEKNGFVALLHNHVGTERNLIKIHCILHQDALCAKSLPFKDVMSFVVKSVNFILSNGLKHRQFKELLDDLESETVT